MDPVAHKWSHVDSARVEPQDEGKNSEEEAENSSEPRIVFLLPSFLEPKYVNQKWYFTKKKHSHVPEADVENVSEAHNGTPGKNAGCKRKSLNTSSRLSIFCIFLGGKDGEGESHGKGDKCMKFEGKSPVVSEEHEDKGPGGETKLYIDL